MADQTLVEVPAKSHESSGGGSLLTPEIELVVLTWVTFFALLWVLKRYAWKPLLTVLEDREKKRYFII